MYHVRALYNKYILYMHTYIYVCSESSRRCKLFQPMQATNEKEQNCLPFKGLGIDKSAYYIYYILYIDIRLDTHITCVVLRSILCIITMEIIILN